MSCLRRSARRSSRPPSKDRRASTKDSRAAKSRGGGPCPLRTRGAVATPLQCTRRRSSHSSTCSLCLRPTRFARTTRRHVCASRRCALAIRRFANASLQRGSLSSSYRPRRRSRLRTSRPKACHPAVRCCTGTHSQRPTPAARCCWQPPGCRPLLATFLYDRTRRRSSPGRRGRYAGGLRAKKPRASFRLWRSSPGHHPLKTSPARRRRRIMAPTGTRAANAWLSLSSRCRRHPDRHRRSRRRPLPTTKGSLLTARGRVALPPCARTRQPLTAGTSLFSHAKRERELPPCDPRRRLDTSATGHVSSARCSFPRATWASPSRNLTPASPHDVGARALL